jgi:hypothetical protein
MRGPIWQFCLRSFSVGVSIAVVCLSSAVYAAHPLITEDTGTQGTENAELQLGFSWTHNGQLRTFSFQPQLSYGLMTTMDLIVQPEWLATSQQNSGDQRGFGDTVVDIKWRFFGRDPVSFALRTGLTIPTSEPDVQELSNRPSAHALLVATVDANPMTIDADLGYVRNPADVDIRANIYHASLAEVFAATDRLALVINPAIDSNSNAHRGTWPAVLLVGVIYTIQPGLDVDIGYQTRLNSTGQAQQWLAGITYRWGP